MKRLITIILVLGAMALVYQFLVTFCMYKHTSQYSIKTGDYSYMITEGFQKSGKHHMYSFYIESQDKIPFVFSYDIDLNKQSKVIQKIESYQNNGLYCIAPVLKGNRVDNIECMFNQQLVSYSYLKQNSNADISNFVSQIKSKNYILNEQLEKEYSTKDTQYNLSIYKEIPEDIYFTIWGYNSLYILNNQEIKMQDLFNQDSYFNENYSILLDKYYITLNTDNSNYNSFYIVNIKDGGKALIESDYEISKNIYFNGVYKKKAYFTDVDNKRQYLVDPYKEEIQEVGTGDESKYFDGKKLTDVNISFLTNDKKYFKEENIPEELENKYSGKNLIESYGNYYYLDSDGSVYQIVGKYYDNQIKLFQMSDFKELKVLNNNVYGISGDTIYLYNNQIGLKKAVENRELLYNYKNIYDVYEK